jgi:hypothetical protein
MVVVAFSGAKDRFLLMWDMELGNKTLLLPASLCGDDGNRRKVLTIATSDDGQFLQWVGEMIEFVFSTHARCPLLLPPHHIQ